MALNSSNTSIRVTPEVLVTRAGEANREIKSMERVLQSIQRVVNATRNYWIGEAGDACRKQYEEQMDEIEAVMVRLKAQPKTLLTIANVYREEEEEAKNISVPLPDNVIE